MEVNQELVDKLFATLTQEKEAKEDLSKAQKDEEEEVEKAQEKDMYSTCKSMLSKMSDDDLKKVYSDLKKKLKIEEPKVEMKKDVEETAPQVTKEDLIKSVAAEVFGMIKPAIQGTAERVKDLEQQPIVKTVGGDFLKKSQDEEQEADKSLKKISASYQHTDLIKSLDEISKGEDMELEQAALLLQANGSRSGNFDYLSDSVIQKCKDKGIKVIR